MGWADLKFARERVDTPAIKQFVEAAGTIFVNGGALVICLSPEDKAAFDSAVRNEHKGWQYPYECVLRSSSLRTQVPELNISIAPSELSMAYISTLGMEGELAYALLSGGAYTQGLPIEQARALARNLMESIVGDAWMRLPVARVDGPWCQWFFDIAWDHTFICRDEAMRRIWIVCLTDTD